MGSGGEGDFLTVGEGLDPVGADGVDAFDASVGLVSWGEAAAVHGCDLVNFSDGVVFIMFFFKKSEKSITYLLKKIRINLK